MNCDLCSQDLGDETHLVRLNAAHMHRFIKEHKFNPFSTSGIDMKVFAALAEATGRTDLPDLWRKFALRDKGSWILCKQCRLALLRVPFLKLDTLESFAQELIWIAVGFFVVFAVLPLVFMWAISTNPNVHSSFKVPWNYCWISASIGAAVLILHRLYTRRNKVKLREALSNGIDATAISQAKENTQEIAAAKSTNPAHPAKIADGGGDVRALEAIRNQLAGESSAQKECLRAQEVGRSDPEKGLKMLDALLEREPKAPGVYNLCGQLSLQIGDLATARDAFERNIATFPEEDHKFDWAYLALAIGLQGDIQKAEQCAARTTIKIQYDFADKVRNAYIAWRNSKGSTPSRLKPDR